MSEWAGPSASIIRGDADKVSGLADIVHNYYPEAADVLYVASAMLYSRSVQGIVDNYLAGDD